MEQHITRKQKNLIPALQKFKKSLDSVELSLEEGDIDKLRDFLEEGKEFSIPFKENDDEIEIKPFQTPCNGSVRVPGSKYK